MFFRGFLFAFHLGIGCLVFTFLFLAVILLVEQVILILRPPEVTDVFDELDRQLGRRIGPKSQRESRHNTHLKAG